MPYIKLIDGRGGLYKAGRWHQVGTQILYTSINPTLARTELVAHIGKIAHGTKCLVLELDDSFPLDVVGESTLPPYWRENGRLIYDLHIITERWIATGQTVGMKVPSVHGTNENIDFNVLLNPLHMEYHNAVKVFALYDVPPLDDRIVPVPFSP